MRYQQFQSVSEHPEDLFNPNIYTKLGTIEIKNVHYAISTDGFIYIQVSTNLPCWADLVNKDKHIKQCSDGLILVNSDDLHQEDVYDIYVLNNNVDLQLVLNEHSYLAPHQNDTAVLHWNLVSSMPNHAGGATVSIKHKLMNCPLCGLELEHDDDSGESYCANSDCNIHKYSVICKFINIACKLPQYQPLCKRFINAKLIKNIEELFTKLPEYLNDPSLSSVEKHKRWKQFGSIQEIEQFLIDLENIKEIKFGDWIQSVPYHFDRNCSIIEDPTKLINHQILKGQTSNYICPDNLNDYFQGSESISISFPSWLLNLSIDFMEEFDPAEERLSEAESLQRWKNEYGKEIEQLMSIPVFFHFTKYIDRIADDLEVLCKLKLMD